MTVNADGGECTNSTRGRRVSPLFCCALCCVAKKISVSAFSGGICFWYANSILQAHARRLMEGVCESVCRGDRRGREGTNTDRNMGNGRCCFSLHFSLSLLCVVLFLCSHFRLRLTRPTLFVRRGKGKRIQQGRPEKSDRQQEKEENRRTVGMERGEDAEKQWRKKGRRGKRK